MSTKTIDNYLVRPNTIIRDLWGREESVVFRDWYPESAEKLQQVVGNYLARAEYFQTNEALVALIAPHAGHIFSGQTAAYAYRQLANRQFDTVVLLGPAHRDRFNTPTISSYKYYWTPIGTVELDQEFIEALERKTEISRTGLDGEHSLDVQLPFLQYMLGEFRLVPIMMPSAFYIVGESAFGPCEQLASALAELVRDKRVLFVASSDLSHLPDYDAVKKFDARTEELVAAYDVPALVQYMWQEHECRACGDAPIVTALLAARARGADRARVLHRTNSGDVTGERDRAQYVVGYMAAAIYRPKVKSEK